MIGYIHCPGETTSTGTFTIRAVPGSVALNIAPSSTETSVPSFWDDQLCEPCEDDGWGESTNEFGPIDCQPDEEFEPEPPLRVVRAPEPSRGYAGRLPPMRRSGRRRTATGVRNFRRMV